MQDTGNTAAVTVFITTQIAKFMGPTWGPAGSCRSQMGPMLAPWTLLSVSDLLEHMAFVETEETPISPVKNIVYIYMNKSEQMCDIVPNLCACLPHPLYMYNGVVFCNVLGFKLPTAQTHVPVTMISHAFLKPWMIVYMHIISHEIWTPSCCYLLWISYWIHMMHVPYTCFTGAWDVVVLMR